MMRVNMRAVVVAAIVHFAFGAFWFTVFANPWRAGTRLTPEEIQNYMAHPMFWPYLISFLCSLGMALVIAWTLAAQCRYGLVRGAITGLMVGIVAALAMITEMVFEMRLASFMMISAGYPLIGSILMGIVIGVWRPKGAAAQE